MKTLETLIPPPVVALVFAVLMWWLASYDPIIDMDWSLKLGIALVFLLLGMIFSLSGVLTFRKAKTTVNPKKPHEASTLVNTGIYQLTRNPMYVGLAFGLSGWAIYLNSLASLLGVIGYVLYIHGFQILPEERALIKLFGQEYEEYKSRVRRWL
jgi:protein-S-isoprenylcysteine O-methyltransferase Ste14